MRTRVLQKLLLREQQAPELEEHAGIGHVMIERKGLLLSNDETSAVTYWLESFSCNIAKSTGHADQLVLRSGFMEFQPCDIQNLLEKQGTAVVL